MKKIYIFLLLFFIIPLKSMEISLEQKKTKRSLHDLLETNEKDIESFYANSLAFISNIENFFYHSPGNKDLTFLIKKMDTLAGENNITEDHMSTYSYNRCNWMTESHKKQYVPIFFGCLKKYRFTIAQTREISPHEYYQDTPPVGFHAEEYKNFKEAYPAYENLIKSLRRLNKLSNLKEILVFLYAKKRMSFHHHYPEAIEIDLENKLCPEVLFLLENEITASDNNLEKLYNLLQAIDKSKTTYPDQHKLALAIFDLKSPIFIKNRIMLFCSLVQQYNEKKGIKKNPTPAHYSHYFLINSLNLALPDSFDATLVDKNTVAFEEFKDLITAIIQLKHQKKEEMQQKVHDIYFKENKEKDEKNIFVTDNTQ